MDLTTSPDAFVSRCWSSVHCEIARRFTAQLRGIIFGCNGCAPAGDHMTKLITNYPLAALILIWTALIGVICILPGTDTTVVAHNLLDGN